MSDFIGRVETALNRGGGPSSDFDLNPEFQLPEGRRLRPAGVLVPIARDSGGHGILLTKRSSALKHHPGQIAFPGGKQDEGDATVIDAALREAEEEIGLPTDHVRVLGTMPTHETVTGFLVTPVVAVIEQSFEIRPERGEVDEVFRVPTDFLLAPENYRVQSRRWRGHQRAYYVVPFGPYYIWGATARMLRTWSDLMTS